LASGEQAEPESQQEPDGMEKPELQVKRKLINWSKKPKSLLTYFDNDRR
jgi:hypothetical protein